MASVASTNAPFGKFSFTEGSSFPKFDNNNHEWAPLPKISECPVYFPTEEEFVDPMKYISSIRKEASKYGICKIVPPSDKWLRGKPFSRVVSYKNFIFQTKLQSIHQLQNRQGPAEQFLEELEQFLENNNTPLKNIPVIDGNELDLYKLFLAVKNRGGVEAVIKNKKWTEITKELKINSNHSSAPHALKQNYLKYLYQFELSKKSKKDIQDSNSKQDMASLGSFGYHDGKMFNLQTFKKMANAFKSKWFPEDNVPYEIVENTYWRIVEQAEEQVQVHYGSDLDVGTHGSGFPMSKEELKNASGWNLNIFPKLRGSLLSHLEENTPGVSEPMMYIGMLYSTFCWHTEDNYLYSINYLHHGAAKTWYGIPGVAAEQFEQVMKDTVPELFKVHSDLMFLLITMISPRVIIQNKVPIYHCVQREGEFMITFPKAYHAGFSHGFNCAESSNFALEDWFEFGRESIGKYRMHARSSVLSFEKLLFNASLSNPNPLLRQKLLVELPVMRQEEQYLRNKVLIQDGIFKAIHFNNYEDLVKECSFCKYDCYLSAVVCPCNKSALACLRHHHKLCNCNNQRKILLFRWRIEDIDDVIQRLSSDSDTIDLMDESSNNNNNHNHNNNKYQTTQMQVEPVVPKISKSRRENPGSAHSGKKRIETHRPFKKLRGVLKPVIRKLARQAGLSRIQGINYLGDEISERMFVIESIVSQRTNTSGSVEYQVKWEGFPDSENTWILAKDLLAPALLEAFQGKLHPGKATNPKRSSTRSTKGRNMTRFRM